MLFAYISGGTLNSPDFWMGMVCGILGTIVIGAICLNNLAKKTTTATDEEKERNTYWWNEGKKPDFDKDYD